MADIAGKKIRNLLQNDLVRSLAFWVVAISLGFYFFGEKIRLSHEHGKRIAEEQEKRMKGFEIVSELPFVGKCKQPGMIFQFDVNLKLTSYRNGRMTASGGVPQNQDEFKRYRYSPPSSVSLKLETWIKSGKASGKILLPATGEIPVQGEEGEEYRQIDLDCEVNIPSEAQRRRLDQTYPQFRSQPSLQLSSQQTRQGEKEPIYNFIDPTPKAVPQEMSSMPPYIPRQDWPSVRPPKVPPPQQ